MALSGLHVVQGYAGGVGANSSVQSLIANPRWSETLATAGTTTNAAQVGNGTGLPIFRIHSTVAAFVVIGQTPNAATGARFYVPADTDYDIFANPDDKLAWVAA